MTPKNPFSHIQFDWYLSPVLLSSSSVASSSSSSPQSNSTTQLQQDDEKNRINRDVFWLQGTADDSSSSSSASQQQEFRYEIIGESSGASAAAASSSAANSLIIRPVRDLSKISQEEYTKLASQYTLKYDKPNRSLRIYSPANNELLQTFTHEKKIISDVHGMKRMPIYTLDISPGGELGVSGSSEGSLRVWNTKTGQAMRDLSLQLPSVSKYDSRSKRPAPLPRGHVGDVYVSRFLPSGEVVMSAGADTRILIWRISDALCAATLKGHNGGVTALSFIDRGRNFISSSRDGTVRLWDCASQSCITEVFRAQQGDYAPINVKDCVVQRHPSLGLGDISAKSTKDFGTEHHVGACAVDDGRAVMFDVRHRQTLFSVKHSSPLTSCSFVDHVLSVGAKNGHVYSYDVRKLSTNTTLESTEVQQSAATEALLAEYKDTTSPVQKLAGGWRNSSELLWFTCQDGSVREFNVQKNCVVRSLSGFDFDAVYDVAWNGGELYCGGRDGKIRQYSLGSLEETE